MSAVNGFEHCAHVLGLRSGPKVFLSIVVRLAAPLICGDPGLELATVRPFHVAAWIEDFTGSKPTIKQKLAAVRMLYDFLVVRQITPVESGTRCPRAKVCRQERQNTCLEPRRRQNIDIGPTCCGRFQSNSWAGMLVLSKGIADVSG